MPLLHDLNDTTRARLDQHGLAVHHGVAVRRDAKALRHVVIGHAGFRQHAADDHAILNSVIGHAFAHDVFAERRSLVDGDADIVIDDYGFATDDPTLCACAASGPPIAPAIAAIVSSLFRMVELPR